LKFKIDIVDGLSGVIEKSAEYDSENKDLFYLEGKNSRVYVERIE
jgi:hypothetical protein